MLFFLISHILSISCSHSVTVSNHPTIYNFNVDEGEYICINSTNPFTTVVFHNSIIKARYFLRTNINTLVESGNFLFPAEKGGVSFGAKIGSIDVMALLPGNLSFSVFAFPPACYGRYVTTKQSKDIELKEIFGDFNKGHYCIWYPQSYYTASVSEVPEDPDSLSICEDIKDCKDPFDKQNSEETVKKPSFFDINAHTIPFYKHFQLSLELKSKRPLIPFDMDEILDISRITLFEIHAPKKPENNIKDEEAKEKMKEIEKERKRKKEEERKKKEEERKKKEEEEENDEKIKDDDDDLERIEKEDQRNNFNKPRLEIPPRHDNRRSSRNEISPFEMIAMVTVVCAVIITFVTCFLCGGNDSLCNRLNSTKGRRRHEEDENRQSEVRLLGNNQGGQPMMLAMMPVYSAQNHQQQMPLTGVYFPPVNPEDANLQSTNEQNNSQNIQPQPLLLLPNPSLQNQSQQNQQPGMQPQYFYPQQFYPQYAFVQPQQIQQMPQMQNPDSFNTNNAETEKTTANTTTDTNATSPTNQ